MVEFFVEETLSGKFVSVMPSLDAIPDLFIKENKINRMLALKRGDCVLIDEIDSGKKTGKKEFVIVAGYTYHPDSYPHLLIYYGEPHEIEKKGKFVVTGQSYTAEFDKRSVRIEIPKI